MRKRTSLNLSPERAGQLRELSLRLGKPITHIIEEMIDEAVAKHGIEFELVTGFDYEGTTRDGEPGVMFGAREIGELFLTRQEAHALCDALVEAGEKNRRTTLPKTQHDASLIEVWRQGRGVIVSVDGRRKSMTPSIAWHLAQCISHEAEG